MMQLILYALILYWPPSGSEKHAQNDVAESDNIVLVRCIGIRMVESVVLQKKEDKEIAEICRTYIADLSIGKSFKGDRDSGVISLVIGYDLNVGQNDDYKPVHESLTLCNSQCGFDIKTNQVYVLFLSKTNGGLDLRSGPFSIAWLVPNGKVRFGKLGWSWQPDKDSKELFDLFKTNF